MPRQPAMVPALSLISKMPCWIPSRPKFTQVTFDADLMKWASTHPAMWNTFQMLSNLLIITLSVTA